MITQKNHRKCLLLQIEELEKKAKEFGFYWDSLSQLIEQIRSECHEIEEAWHKGDRPHLQEEIGDLIHAAISLSIFCAFDPYETLLKNIEKFQKRYNKLVGLVQQDGLSDLHNQSLQVLLDYWSQAKESDSTGGNLSSN